MPAADPIAALLAGTYRDPESGALLRAESRSVVIEDSLEGSEAELVAALGVGKHVAVVGDAVTFGVLGRRVQRALASRYVVQAIELDAPRADADTVARLQAALAPSTDAVIAVGSGTLNDLTKMVAFERDIPQLIFATAPSMNGYTSLSASIITDGVKRSYRTRTPLGVFFDLRVLAAAPLRLIRAGLGDSACRATAQADWLLSHLLLDRPYREVPFAMLADDEQALLAGTSDLVAGDLGAMRHLVRTLVLSGFGMTICNGSYPASQGEHLLSHYIEMTRPGVPRAFHGEQIAVCSVAMARIQEQILDGERPPVLRPPTVDRAEVIGHFGPVIGDACWREFEHKRFTGEALDALNDRLAREWSAIRARIAAVTLGADRQRAVLAAAGAPCEPGDLGWSPAVLDAAVRHAREIRNRYTFLDVLADALS